MTRDSIIQLGHMLEKEDNAAHDLWTWLPSARAARRFHGDYASEYMPSVADVMREAAIVFSCMCSGYPDDDSWFRCRCDDPEHVLSRAETMAVICRTAMDKARAAAAQDRGPDAYVVRLRDLRVALAEVDRLTAALAEAEATIANERGEGEPPEPGWTWEEGPSGQHFGVGQWVCVRSTTGVPNAIVRQNTGCAGASARWAWHVHVPNAGGYEKTARAAMRAAAGVKS